MHWPMRDIEHRELATVPTGLYRILNRERTSDYYNAADDRWDRNVVQDLIARVDYGKELPGVCEQATIDETGRRVILSWEPRARATQETN